MRRPFRPPHAPAIGIGIILHERDSLGNHSGQPHLAADGAGRRVLGGLCNLGFFRLFQLLEYRGVRSTWSGHDLHIVSAADLPESSVVFARTRNINDVWLDRGRHSRTGSGALSLQSVARIIDSSPVQQSITASHMTL